MTFLNINPKNKIKHANKRCNTLFVADAIAIKIDAANIITIAIINDNILIFFIFLKFYG